MIYRSTKQQVDEYHADSALNQSSIKVIVKEGMQSYIAKRFLINRSEEDPYGEKQHLTIGSAVDCILTMGKEEFNNQYHVSTINKKPGAGIMSVIKCTLEKVVAKYPINSIIGLSSYTKEIYEACNEVEFYPNRAKTYEEDERYVTILKDNIAEAYWQDLISSNGKQVLSSEEDFIIERIADSFLHHKHTSFLFEDSSNIDIIYQCPLFFTFNGVLCKILPDEIRIEHSSKKIKILDFKTYFDYVLNFPQQIRGLRHDIQLSFYKYGISQNLHVLSSMIGKNLSTYEITFPAFIVESTKRPKEQFIYYGGETLSQADREAALGTPLIYPLTQELTDFARTGGFIGEYEYKGWEQGIETYKRWEEKGFSIDEMMEGRGGVLLVGNTFKTLVNI